MVNENQHKCHKLINNPNLLAKYLAAAMILNVDGTTLIALDLLAGEGLVFQSIKSAATAIMAPLTENYAKPLRSVALLADIVEKATSIAVQRAWAAHAVQEESVHQNPQLVFADWDQLEVGYVQLQVIAARQVAGVIMVRQIINRKK